MKRHALCLLFMLSCLVPTAVFPQDEFDVSADRLSGSKVGDREIVTLEGNVRIVHGATVATADTGYYERSRERVNLIGSVVVEDGDIRVRGDRAEYLRTQRRVLFPRGITVVDSVSTLTADRGHFDLENEVLKVDGNVAYSEGARSLNADHTVYYRKTGSVKAHGNVVLADTDYGATVRAGRVEYERDKGYGIASEDPWLETTARDERRAMSIKADSMEIYTDERKAVAIGGVSIFRDDAIASCGRAVFLEEEDKSILTDGPVIIEEGSSLSGETITIFTSEDEVSEVLVSGHAQSIYQPPDEEKTELAGSEIRLLFRGGEVYEMHITGEASAVFSPTEVDAAGQAQQNEVTGARLILAFDHGEAQRATVTGGVEGMYKLEDEGADGGLVAYRSDSLHYDVPTAMMYLRGNAAVEYKGMKLNSEMIEYNATTHSLHASVDPILWEGNDKITGSSLIYNLKSKRGAIISGRTGYEKGLYTGRVIRKTGERALNVQGGTYTSCNHLDPHYAFTSSKMKMYVNDKVITKPVILRIRGVPIMALPFFMFPIRKGRHSGILIPRVEFGFDEAKGRFIRNAGYYWAPNDYMDLTLWGDYYENSKWIGHMESRYKVRYLLEGTFEGSYQSELGTGDSRWDIGGRHNQQLGENGRLIVHADFVSDKKYRQETSDDLEKALRRQLESDVSYSNRWDGKSFTIAAERRENLDTDQISQTLPRLSFLLGRITLLEPSEDDTGWHQGTYLNASSNASATLTKTGEDQETQQQAKVNAGMNTDLRFGGKSQTIRSTMVLTAVRKDIGKWWSDGVGGKVVNSAYSDQTDFIAKFKPFGWIDFDPSLTASATIYDEDKAGKRGAARLMYWGGVSTTTSIFKTFFPRIGPLQALRHVISPRITYTHRPDFSKYRNRFYSLPGISGEISKSRMMNISVSNKLQAKVGSGAEVKKMNNLLSFDTSTSYDFLYKDKGKETPLSTINNKLRFYPSDVITFDLDFTNNPEDLAFESLNLTTRLSCSGKEPLPPGFTKPELKEEPLVPEEGVGGSDAAAPTGKPWHTSAIFRYTKAYNGGDDNYWLDFQAGFSFTTNWRVEYSGRFDLSGKETVHQEYSIYRDLHCWEARFVRRYSAGEWQYYFRINIKAHPEIYTERGLRTLYRQY
ncbi:MAG: putative LPS assembly protein LptD [Candidatus Eisenbacteria bacterium]